MQATNRMYPNGLCVRHPFANRYKRLYPPLAALLVQGGVEDSLANCADIDQSVNQAAVCAYQTAAWWLRRAANLSLKDTVDVFGVSPSHISPIQRMIESRGLT
jgi:hypothetical protein